MEFLNLLCKLYLLVLTVVLPLYTEGTYWKIGDAKYILFRNLSLLCLGLWLAVALAELLRQGKQRKAGGRGFSVTDGFVLAYGGAVMISAVLSRYGITAWRGYDEWYMGAVSQFLFVGIYFFVSRCYDGRKYPLICGTAAFLAVTLLGILHRLGIDPTGLMRPFGIGHWEYSHMLSTLGNINWFCGYCSVALTIPLTGYIKAKKKAQAFALYGISAMGLFLLFVQGSDIGVVLTAVAFGICLLCGLRDRAAFGRTILLGVGVCVLIPCYGLLARLLGEDALTALPADGIGWNIIHSGIWWIAAAVGALMWCCLLFLQRNNRLEGEKIVRYASVVAMGAAFLACTVSFSLKQPVDGMWGSGRGTLWRIAWQGFLENAPLQKWIGVGPDCFAEYIYSAFSGEELLILEGRWVNAVYANAHNEWLNHLVNLGIMGTGCYLSIFVSAMWRYRKSLMGVLALAMYGAASLTCFQQCLSTPLLFMVLGICESTIRRFDKEKQYEVGEIQSKDNYGG